MEILSSVFQSINGVNINIKNLFLFAKNIKLIKAIYFIGSSSDEWHAQSGEFKSCG